MTAQNATGTMLALSPDGVIPTSTRGIESREGSALTSSPSELVDFSEYRTTKRRERELVIHRASEIEPKAIDWLWPGRIALGKLSIVAGEPGTGKSHLSAFLAAAVSIGGQLPADEGNVPQGDVIILSAEDDACDTIRPRLQAAGADLGRVFIVSAVRHGTGEGGTTFNLEADLDLLEKEIARIGNVRLVIIDPISSYLGTIDAHKNSEVRSVLEPLGEMAARLGLAVVAVTHLAKNNGIKAINRVIGSIGFVAAARAVHLVAKDPHDGDRRLFVILKNNLSADRGGLAFRVEQHAIGNDIASTAIVWEAEPVTLTADEIVGAGDAGERRPAQAEAERFLTDLLANGSIAQKEVDRRADQAGHSRASVKRAKQSFKIESTRVGGVAGDGEWLWSLPGNSPADAK
jgi:hypothetical protein